MKTKMIVNSITVSPKYIHVRLRNPGSRENDATLLIDWDQKYPDFIPEDYVTVEVTKTEA